MKNENENKRLILLINWKVFQFVNEFWKVNSFNYKEIKRKEKWWGNLFKIQNSSNLFFILIPN